ncbi:hypothetical protein [Natrialba asiatica]|nr:hypothetical protein [Natrialba asiatica]
MQEEREKFHENSNQNSDTIFKEVTYSQTTENDPVDTVSDIVRSSITEEDTGTAKRVLNEYIDRIEPIIIQRYRYRGFKTSHSDSQLVCWYLYGPLEDIFRHALKHDNHIITMEVISLLRESIVSWYKADRDVPEVFFRLFGSITNDYVTECDQSQRRTIASEYSSVARIVAKDIDSPHTRVNGATKHNFGSDCMNFALESISQGDYRPGRVITHGIRLIIEARLRIPSSNPKRDLLSMGLIGEKFAMEEAKSKEIVAVADEVSIMDEAEWTVVTLVTFLDKIDEYGNGYSTYKYRELVVKEIDRINDALEPRNKDIANKVPQKDSLVKDVVRASRFFRSSFTPEKLLQEIHSQIDVQEIADVCEELVKVNAMAEIGENEYKTTYENI